MSLVYSIVIACIPIFIIITVTYLFYSMKGSYSDVETAVKKSECTKDILTGEVSYKYFQKNKDAFFLVMDKQNDFMGVHLKKGLLGWNVKASFGFKGISFSDQDIKTITIVGIDLGKSALLLCRFSEELFKRIQINGVEIEKLMINGTNKGLGFLIEIKKVNKVVEGFSKDGALVYEDEIKDEIMIKFKAVGEHAKGMSQ